jgi:steroid delta-isomerase-like uncharacterized protein
MSKQNEALVQRFIDRYLNTGDRSVLDEFLTPDCQLFCNAKCEASDVAGYDDLVTKFRAAFPDLDHTLNEVLSTDDRLAYRWTNRGTHLGEFEGIPPTGKRIEFTGTTIFRFRDGKIAEEWTSVDLLALMEQLGVIPVPEDAAV